MNLNAVEVFEPMGYSPIPTDICLVGTDDNSIDEFDTQEQSPVYDTDDPTQTKYPVDYANSPCDATDTYNWQDDNVDDVRALIDTGAMVTCTGLKSIIHLYKAYTKLHPCPIRLKAALDTNQSVVPEGHGILRCRTPDGHGCVDVHVYYHPSINGTLLSPTSVIESSRESNRNFTGQTIHRWFTGDTLLTGNVTLICHHRRSTAKDIIIHGRLFGGQLYTHPLILPDVDAADPTATLRNSFHRARTQDTSFIDVCKRVVNAKIANIQARKHHELNQTIRDVPDKINGIHLRGLKLLMDKAIPIYAIRSRTEKLLWHQRLGHPCDEYLYNAHKFITGVPKFDRQTTVLDQCPTCIRAKQTKTPAGPHSTRIATQPYQGLSIDFCFTGVASKDTGRRQDYEGINGETCWILVTDHFTGMKHGDTRISKGPPLQWLAHFLAQYNPQCANKYVHLDQGGELFNHPEVRNLFEHKGYDIRPTGADNSRQNGPVERGHRTLANTIRTLLLGANLAVKFWPYAFYHALRMSNAFPERTRNRSPVCLSTGKQEDFSNIRTFGCRVWVRPPGHRAAKLKPNSRKGIFLGYVPHTTRNILWYDVETSRIKIATHARFDEGMNDLPVTDMPPNVAHLRRTDDGSPPPADVVELSTAHFAFDVVPAVQTFHGHLNQSISPSDPTFGLSFEDDPIQHRAFVTAIAAKSASAALCSSHKSTRRKLLGAYILEIAHDRVFTALDATAKLAALHNQGVGDDPIPITFALEAKLSASDIRKRTNESGLFATNTKWDENENIIEDEPFMERAANRKAHLNKLHAQVRQHLCHTEDDMEVSVPTLDLHSLRAIAQLRHPNTSFDTDTLPSDLLEFTVDAIRSSATTSEEQALGFFTRRKLKKLSTWDEWQQGETKQLNQFHDLQMFGEPIAPPIDPKTIILRPHWQYHIKRCGTRRARLCCNGSKYAAPLLHELALTYSSCVEHPIQRLFFAIAANLNLKVYGGDAKDAFAHSPGPDMNTYLAIDDAYAEWYKRTFTKSIDRSHVLPINRALQGHPESGRLWEIHINAILTSPELNFKTTTHDRTIYTANFDGETVYLLRQVDDFALACTNEALANSIYDTIGKKLQLPKEDKPPFSKMGLITDFNGIDVTQTDSYIKISCATYIDRLVTTHGWKEDKRIKEISKTIAPLSTEALKQVYEQKGPLEETSEHKALETKSGFLYRTLLGEMMYAYVTCRPDIGYAITLLSKFGSSPSAYHYTCLKNVARYLRATKHWGIQFSRPSVNPDLELTKSDSPSVRESNDRLPDYPELITQGKLIGFVDAAYANDLAKRRSTTGYVFTYSGGAVVYRSKTQSLTALSSTEAEFIAAVTAAKTAKYIRSVLADLGFKQLNPTTIYEDNKPTIDIVASQKPTERTRHIDIRFFAIQDWTHKTKDIALSHIPGVINPSDDLTKPLGQVLHERHARYIMGHYNVVI